MQLNCFSSRGDDALALLGTAHDDLPAAQEIAVEGVHGLAHLEQHKLVMSTMSETERRPQSARRRRIQRGEVPILTSFTKCPT